MDPVTLADPATLLQRAEADGVVVRTVDGQLEIEADDTRRHWLAKLRPHKESLTRLLGGEPSATELPPPDAMHPSLVCMADVESRPISWLWRNRIARGRVTLLVGMPGCGKSFVTCDLASRISTGTPWPDGEPCERGSTLFITAEDDPHDTIRPRLDAHRADLSRVHLLSGIEHTQKGEKKEYSFTLADVDILAKALDQVPDCRLVVVDPIGSFLGSRCDAHRDNEVRSVLAPIARLAEQYGTAILLIAHRRKGSATSADDTALGSRAFTGLARSVWHLSRDPDDASRRLLLPGKSNLAAETTGLAFTIAASNCGAGASVRWERDPVTMTADEALAREGGRQSAAPSATEEAVEWLRDHLAAGPHPAKEVQEAAVANGISVRTLNRAKALLRIQASPDGYGDRWVCRLPEEPDPPEVANLVPDFAVFAKENTLANTEETVANTVATAETRCPRCDSPEFRETPIHNGQSTRRDCARCGRTLDFPVWEDG